MDNSTLQRICYSALIIFSGYGIFNLEQTLKFIINNDRDSDVKNFELINVNRAGISYGELDKLEKVVD